MKLIKILQTFKNKKGEEISAYNFYIVVEGANEVRICIKPAFANDNNLLKAFAEKVD